MDGIETNVMEINGTYYVRIPKSFAEYFKLKHKMAAKISDMSATAAKIDFPLRT